MFLENNIKYRYLVDSIQYLRSTKDLKMMAAEGVHFSEMNVICLGGVRQSGKSTAIRKNFNPEKDILITYNRFGIQDFFFDKVDLNNGSLIHSWSLEEKDKMRIRDSVLSMRSNSLMHRVDAAMKYDSVVYLDVCSVELEDSQAFVRDFIELLNKLRLKGSERSDEIIVVYT